MIIEWKGIGIISLILVACMLVIVLLEKILKLKPETRRKGFHMAMGFDEANRIICFKKRILIHNIIFYRHIHIPGNNIIV